MSNETEFGDIHIVHLREPDAECHVEVWINGTKVKFEEWTFDPGAGYEMKEYQAMKSGAVEAAPDWLKDRIAEAYDDMEPTYERWSL